MVPYTASSAARSFFHVWPYSWPRGSVSHAQAAGPATLATLATRACACPHPSHAHMAHGWITRVGLMMHIGCMSGCCATAGCLAACWGCSSGTCWAMAPEKPRTANCTAKPAADSGLLALQWKGLPAVRLAIGAPPFCALQLDWDVRLLPARFAAVTLGWVRITRPATRRAEVAAAAPAAAPAAIETGIDSSDEIQCKRPPGRSARYGQRHGDLYCARSRFGICPWAR
jgi:hypothetical protein